MDGEESKMNQDKTDEQPREQEILMSEIQYKVLMAFREHPNFNQTQVGQLLGIEQTKVSKALRQLLKNNPDNFLLNREVSLYNKSKKYNPYTLTLR
jgi:DNA-binding MarR family transcriptional regulator